METGLEKNHHGGGGLKRRRCSVQNYDWGKKGTEGSEVARLYELNSGSDIELEKKKPFAEFWMGTHGSGPSFVVESGVENGDSIGSGSMGLKEWILKNPNVLGDGVLDKWGCDLPFLFKVQSFFFLYDFVCVVFEFMFWLSHECDFL
jgi:mannose-6-phosphate isomerase